MTTAQKFTCSKCNGRGKLVHYGHIAEGVCFDCAGTGKCEAKQKGTHTFAPRSAEELRFVHIEKFRIALGRIEREGKSWLSEIEDAYCVPVRTEKDVIKAWLDSDKCPSDVRTRAIVAFSKVGVAF